MSKHLYYIYGGLFLLFFSETLLWLSIDISDFLLPILLANSFILFGLALYDTSLCFNLVILILPVKNILLKYEVGIVTFNIYMAGIFGLFIAYIIKATMRFSLMFDVKSADKLLFLFAVYSLSFFFVSPDYLISGYVFLHSVFIPLCGYVIVRYCLDSKEKYDVFRWHFLISVFILAVATIVIYFTQGGRTLSVFGTNALKSASYFVLAFLLMFNSFDKKKFICSCVYLFAFILCLCRVYLFNMILLPMYFLVLKHFKVRSFVLGIIIITFSFTLLTISLYDPIEYANITRKYYKTSGAERKRIAESSDRLTNIDHWKISYYGLAGMWRHELATFSKRPFVGKGIGNTDIRGVTSSHNLHVQLLCYEGVLGWLLFHFFFFASFKFVQFSNHKLSHDFKSVILVAVMIYMNGTTNGLFHGDFNYFLFILLALIQNMGSYQLSYGTHLKSKA
ncbi:MAG TPA: hypothetical protein ENN33_13540 [Ignavibacteria bacterium]|nr:hypothetical protein [Ignavibacteria bacterium]